MGKRTRQEEVNISSAVSFINSLGPSVMILGLGRMRRVMNTLKNPQDQFPSIHIAGTNGKGSVAAMMAAVLKETGLRVGLYTSPHLVRLHERFQINGQSISNRELSLLTRKLRNILARPPLKSSQLTQFEFLTALAFLWFEKKKVDVAVVEVGLGGRLDATNIMKRVLVSIITNIDLDHTQWLGYTIKEIAFEKAGIIKPHIPVVTGAHKDAFNVIKKVARKRKAPLYAIPQNVRRQFPYKLSLKGGFQKNNACLVLGGLKILNEKCFPIGDGAIKKGLAHTFWPGRFERIKRNIILDGAHNPAGIAVLTKTLQEEAVKKVNLLFGVLKDKNYPLMVKTVMPFVHRAVIVPVPSDRSALPAEILRLPHWKGRAESAKTLREGWKRITTIKDRHPILVTGSLFLIGAVRKILGGR
ncbi:MAG: bifunctional folylpolyglutamate synthase/dihydrofolate synthase [Elusimicrobia bacterium]|nr:bifunctional folylpolyglutamate synthase/dihydrofolate synthase [Candidatus Obscuribacterium magneticum]